jgi:hypothetical protein
MAHFARLDEDNTVINVITVNNAELLDASGIESEAKGIEFCKSLFGQDTAWVQTSYNKNFRHRFAGIGCTYDSLLDAFILPQPYPSWVLNPVTCDWEAPISKPDDGLPYDWDETLGVWRLAAPPEMGPASSQDREEISRRLQEYFSSDA